MDPRPAPRQRVIEVTGPHTIETDAFRFTSDFRGMEVIESAGTVTLGFFGDIDVNVTQKASGPGNPARPVVSKGGGKLEIQTTGTLHS